MVCPEMLASLWRLSVEMVLHRLTYSDCPRVNKD